MPTFREDLHLGHKVPLIETDDIMDGAITTEKIADNAVTEEKLSQELRNKIESLMPIISLGFYTDEEVPAPVSLLPVRVGHINETIVPYLLLGPNDISELVTSWKWERESNNPETDAAWNRTERAKNRKLTLTDEDFPPGWDLPNHRISFKCTATFLDEDPIQIINRIVIK